MQFFIIFKPREDVIIGHIYCSCVERPESFMKIIIQHLIYIFQIDYKSTLIFNGVLINII